MRCEPGLPWAQASPSVLAQLACPQDREQARHQILLLIDQPSSSPRPPTPLADRAFSTFPSFGSVGAWLEALDLGRYKDSFTAAGYGSLEAVATMTAQ